MDKYLDFLYNAGVYKAEKIDAAGIITGAWTDYKCRYGCDFYGKKNCCPPYTHSWKETQEIIDCYKYGILFNVREGAGGGGEETDGSGGGFKGGICTPSERINVSELAVELSRQAFLDGYYKSIAFGSGPCLICKECDLKHCRFPKKAVPSMEGCGIDVFATARLNGFEIDTVKEKNDIHNYFGLVLFE